MTEKQDKSHMFWTEDPTIAYKDGVPIPRVTYRCKASATKEAGLRTRKHDCKKVTDHPGSCECICGMEFNVKEEAIA